MCWIPIYQHLRRGGPCRLRSPPAREDVLDSYFSISGEVAHACLGLRLPGRMCLISINQHLRIGGPCRLRSPPARWDVLDFYQSTSPDGWPMPAFLISDPARPAGSGTSEGQWNWADSPLGWWLPRPNNWRRIRTAALAHQTTLTVLAKRISAIWMLKDNRYRWILLVW